jgi:hypothetical protein
MAKTSADWSYFLSEQKRIAQLAFKDAENRKLVGLAIIAGTISSIALAKLYTKLTPDESDDDLRSLAGTGLAAIGIGVATVLWKANLAQYRLPTLQDLPSISLPDMSTHLTDGITSSLEDVFEPSNDS